VPDDQCADPGWTGCRRVAPHPAGGRKSGGGMSAPKSIAERPAEVLVSAGRVAREDNHRTRPLIVEFVGDFLAFAGLRAVFAAIFLIAGAFLEGMGLLLLVPLLSVVLGASSGTARLDQFTAWCLSLVPGASQSVQLVAVLLLFGLVMALRAFVIFNRDLILARLQIGFVESHRLHIISQLSRSPWNVITRLRHARITHVLGPDIQACADASALLLHLAVAGTMLLGHGILMLLLSPSLALVIFVMLGAGALILRPVLRRSRNLGQSLTDANLILVTNTSQFLAALKLAVSQNLQQGFVAGFETNLSESAARRMEFARQRTTTQLTLVSAGAVIASLIILAGVGVFGTSAASLLAFLFVLSRMTGPLAQFQGGAQQIFHSLPAYRKIRELESELRSEELPEPSAPLPGFAGHSISFENVSFWHEGGAPTADRAGGVYNVALEIAAGAFVGLRGPSGAGKSTFCDLLVGLYPPREGVMKVDGRPLAGRLVPAWRSSLSYVSQEPFLFHDTIRANLLWAAPGSSEEELWDALRMASGEGFVRALDLGLDTIVGDRGSLLSGGERQRIAIARALLRKPCLLILDEATNAIDPPTEAALLGRLSKAEPRPTIVMVSHRDESLHYCERIIELRDGRIDRIVEA
jgi:ABC-type multidrug transport system fused ATPase/permease subunit